MKRTAILLVSIMLVASMILSGCFAKQQPQTLTVGCEGTDGIFNQNYTNSSYSTWAINLLFEGLIMLDKTGTYVPAAAKEWKVSEDGLTYTFTLRDNLQFSDGKPLTAEDVEYTYLMVADPKYDGMLVDNVVDFKGFAEYSAEGSTLTAMEGIKVIDKKTIAFTFAEKKRTNLAKLGLGIMPKHYYVFEKGNVAATASLNDKPLGAGPYMIEKYEPNQYISMVKNPKYWDAKAIKIDRVVIKSVDSATEMDELQTGKIDLIPGSVEADKRDTARNDANLAVYEFPRSGFGYINFNCSEVAATHEKEVRQALSYAFQGEAVIDTLFTSETGTKLAKTQSVPFSQVSWAFTDELLKEVTSYTYDLAKANKILDDAGWAKGADGIREKNGKKLIIKMAAMPEHPILDSLVPLLQKWWGEDIGAKLEVEYMEFNAILDYISTNADTNEDKWDCFFLANTFPSADPDSVRTSYASDEIKNNGQNTNRLKNEELDAMFKEAVKIIDQEAAKKAYIDIFKLLTEENPTLVVYANVYADLASKRLKGHEPGPLFSWELNIKNLTLEPVADAK